jgi:hypothetical protein
VNAVADMGWSAPAKVQAGYAGRGELGPDLSIKLPSREILVTVRELDERGRPGRAFITQTDYLPHTERATVNKSFTASGRLEVTLTRGWEQHPVLSQRDTGRSTLEDQLPALIRVLEIGLAEADWARKEEERRSEIREDRWKEVKKEAFVHVADERNAKRLLTELDSRDAAAAMRAYADEIDARDSALEAPAARAARRWAEWIREHAERTDPLNGPSAQSMSPRSGSSPKHSKSTHALRRLGAAARTLTPNRPTGNDDRPSLAMKGTVSLRGQRRVLAKRQRVLIDRTQEANPAIRVGSRRSAWRPRRSCTIFSPDARSSSARGRSAGGSQAQAPRHLAGRRGYCRLAAASGGGLHRRPPAHRRHQQPQELTLRTADAPAERHCTVFSP